jgi:hypothetical protein
MDGALATANVAKYFTAGPVLLGGGSVSGRSAWIAFIPLIIVVFMSATMGLWLWGRRQLLLQAAQRTVALLELGRMLGHKRAEERQPASGKESIEQALAAVRLRSHTDLASLSEHEASTSFSAPHIPGKGSFSSMQSFSAVKLLGAVEYESTHTELGSALAHLLRLGVLGRPPAVGIYLFSGASLLDTEAMAGEEVVGAVHPLELPHALLHNITMSASLPQLTVLMAVEFTPGLAFVLPENRVTVRRIAPPDEQGGHTALPGVFHVCIRYGFAERPKSERELCGMLLALGAAACKPGADCRELAALTHLHCCLRGTGACGCSVPGAPAACLPLSFVVSRDALCPAAGAPLPRRLAAACFNAIALLASSSSFLKLPPEAVSELFVPVTLGKEEITEEESASGLEGAGHPAAVQNASTRRLAVLAVGATLRKEIAREREEEEATGALR